MLNYQRVFFDNLLIIVGFCQPIENGKYNLQAIIGIARNKPAEPVRNQVFDAAQVV